MTDFQKFHVSVKGLIRCNDRFLLLQEDDGLWEAPGGRVNVGELLEVALLRELKEEIGLDLKNEDIDKLVGIDQRYDYKLGDGWALMTFFYKINLTNNVNINLSDEHIDYIWVNKNTNLDKFQFKNQNQRNIFESFRETL